MCEIAINTNLHKEQVEVEISGTCAGFATVTQQLVKLSTGVFTIKNMPNRYYPTQISRLSLETVVQSSGVITALVDGADFKLSGDVQAFRKLTDFLASLSSLSPGEHFHLDWFANEDLLAPATADMSFVFLIEA
jgi:hypothetical protein